jgi:glycosyltransferase involved in cell wall biosynthesis
MRVLMLGWEFPPLISGGLGTACYGLTKAMSELGTEVLFVLPRPVGAEYSNHLRILDDPSRAKGSTNPARQSMQTRHRVAVRAIPSALGSPYRSPGLRLPELAQSRASDRIGAGPPGSGARSVQSPFAPGSSPGEIYGHDLLREVGLYAERCLRLAGEEHFDVIHAHDWMTYPAALAISESTGKPVVVHVHSTEFDRSGENVDQRVYDIERLGMHRADAVVCVSNWTRRIILDCYQVNPEQVSVIYNGVERPATNPTLGNGAVSANGGTEKIVLFLGRITMQKGPEYFVAAAKKVLEIQEDVKFIMAGSGDQLRQIVQLVAELGLGHKVLFAGFLRPDDVERAFRLASLYVMPSVSEPFGIAPLEAVARGVPVIVSKSSGVAEVLSNALKVDFWDTHELANKIVAVLRHGPLAATLRERAAAELKTLTWRRAASKSLDVYGKLLRCA